MKRWLLRICVFLPLGALVTVAVAWALAANPSDAPLQEFAAAEPPGSQMSGEWIALAQRRTVGRTQNWYQTALMKDVRPSGDGRALIRTLYPTCGNDDGGPWDIEYPLRGDSWSRLGFVMVNQRSLYVEAEIASGWPAVALWGCMAGYDRDSGEKMHVGCIGLGQLQTTEYTDSHETCLPYRPIWPGFAINTAFYAVGLWGLFAAPFALRRRWRLRRGLCMKCAYDLRGRPPEATSCPECGAAVNAQQKVGVDREEPVVRTPCARQTGTTFGAIARFSSTPSPYQQRTSAATWNTLRAPRRNCAPL